MTYETKLNEKQHEIGFKGEMTLQVFDKLS